MKKAISLFVAVLAILTQTVWAQKPLLQLPLEVGYKYQVITEYGGKTCLRPPNDFNSYHTGKSHYALDFDNPTAPSVYEKPKVLAAAAGKVVKSEYDDCLGNYIKIDHGNNYSSIYGHLDSRLKAVNAVVKMGEEIGVMGNTGSCSKGSHLHFVLKQGDDSVLPEPMSGYSNKFGAGEVAIAIPPRHPAGSLVRTANNSNLYMLIPDIPNTSSAAQKKVLIPSSSFGSEGINTSKAITITQKEMDSYVDAGSYAMLNKDNYPTIFRGNGDFLFKIGTPVYLYDKSAGKKRRVYTDKAMFSWGYGWSNVASSGPSYAKNATDGEPLYYRDGALVRGQSNSAVYVLENGYKRAFQTYDIFAALGCKDANIVWLSDYDINNNVGIKGAGQMLTSTNIWQSGEYPLVISAGVYPPQNLAIVSVTMSSVNLSWQDNQNSGAAYKVFRANSGNTIEYATGITALSFTDNSVTKGQTKGKIFF